MGTALFFGFFGILNVFLAIKYRRNTIFWFLVGFGLPIIGLIALVYMGRNYKCWPTVDEYMAANPKSNQGNGIFCNKCGARNIKSMRAPGIFNNSRLFFCNSCDAGLYRSN